MHPYHGQGCLRQTNVADSKTGRREQKLEGAAGRELRDSLGRKQTPRRWVVVGVGKLEKKKMFFEHLGSHPPWTFEP